MGKPTHRKRRDEWGTRGPELARESLFQYFHDHRGIARVGLCDQKMEVLRHDYETDQHKVVAQSRLFQSIEQEVTALRRAQHWFAMVTTGRNEMQVIRTVIAMKPLRHLSDGKLSRFGFQ